jgi:hypothetical protein
MFSKEKIAILKQEFEGIFSNIVAYFNRVFVELPYQNRWKWPHDFDINEWYSSTITEQDRREAEILSQNLTRVVKDITIAAKSSPLVDDADIRDMRISLKKIRSALFFRDTDFGILRFFTMKEQS